MTEQPSEREASGLLGEGIITALAVIASSLAVRAGVAPELRRDLEAALQALQTKPQPERHDPITQHALRETMLLLRQHEALE